MAEARAGGCRSLPHATRWTVEKGQGRIEERRVRTTTDPEPQACLDPAGAWPKPGCVALVEAERRTAGAVATESRYYVSIPDGSAQDAAEAVGGHCGIENRVHWVLDACSREDDPRAWAERADRNPAVLRRLALNPPHQEATATVGAKAKRLKAG